ncbi:hypothetical protein INN88_15700, partial [Staphylococcus aureus]|nr:hypothetical protein [Staphylococcus aureus]
GEEGDLGEAQGEVAWLSQECRGGGSPPLGKVLFEMVLCLWLNALFFFFFLVYRGLDMEMNMNDVDDDIVEVCVKYCWAM